MPRDERAVFLVGFMGAGKTTAGRELARALGWDFTDTDDVAEQRAGRPVAQIIEHSGEAHFRRVEWDALRALDPSRRVVVACGGGLFLGYPQRRWLAGRGVTVWLDVPLDVARERLREAGHTEPRRPLWLADDPVGLRALFERRRATYALAAIRVDGAAGPPPEVARRIRDRLDEIPS